MINYGKNKNVLAGNFQKTIRFAARLLERLDYRCNFMLMNFQEGEA